MSSTQVTIYSSQACAYCQAAKQLLNKRGIPFQEVDVTQLGESEWDALLKRSGMKTIPQIFFGEKLIGGFTELAKLDKENGLSSLAAA